MTTTEGITVSDTQAPWLPATQQALVERLPNVTPTPPPHRIPHGPERAIAAAAEAERRQARMVETGEAERKAVAKAKQEKAKYDAALDEAERSGKAHPSPDAYRRAAEAAVVAGEVNAAAVRVAAEAVKAYHDICEEPKAHAEWSDSIDRAWQDHLDERRSATAAFVETLRRLAVEESHLRDEQDAWKRPKSPWRDSRGTYSPTLTPLLATVADIPAQLEAELAG